MRRSFVLCAVLLMMCGGGHESPTTPPMTPTPTASLSGTVTTVGTTSPVAGATVSVSTQSMTTGTDGKYAFSGLAAGQVTLTVQRSGYESFSRTITLISGTNALDVSLSQSTSGTSVTGNVHGLFPISGQVVNLSGATVTIAGKTDTADASGNFQLPTIPEGQQQVTVRLAGWKDYSQSFFVSSTNRNLSLQMEYGLPVFTTANIPGQPFVCRCTGGNNHFIAAGVATLNGAASQYAYTITAASWRLAPVQSGGAECTGCSRMSSHGLPNAQPGTCATAERVCCPSNGNPICPIPSPITTGEPGVLYDVAAGQAAAAGRVLVERYGVLEQNCGPIVYAMSGARLTITGIRVAATNDVNQWTHYDLAGTVIIEQPWSTSNTSCP